MTTTPNAAAVGLLPVTQADRDRAISLFPMLGDYDVRTRDGHNDSDKIVQAFAAHRLAAERPRPEALPAEVERIGRLLFDRLRDRVRGKDGQRTIPAWEKQTPEYRALFVDDAKAVLAALPPAGGAQLREALKRAAVDLLLTPRHNRNGVADRHIEESRDRIRIALHDAALAAPEPGGVEAYTGAPPPHWTGHVNSSTGDPDRYPATAAEWDYRNDPGGDERKALAEKRIRFAYVLADPRAPDQMALVHRRDLGDLLHDLIRFRAVFELWKADREKAQPPATPADEGEVSRELLALRAIKAIAASWNDPKFILGRIMRIARDAGVPEPYSDLLKDARVAALVSDAPLTERQAILAALRPSSGVAVPDYEGFRSTILRDLHAERRRYNENSPTWRAYGFAIHIVEEAAAPTPTSAGEG